MTADEVCDVVLARRHAQRKNFAAPKYVAFRELRAGIGHHPFARQRIDLWVLNTWASERAVDAYEVKVSRSDFRREIVNPEKRAVAMRWSNRFWFATPKGLIEPHDVPYGCGLVEVQDGKARVRLEAPFRPEFKPTMELLCVVARRALGGIE